MSFFRLSQCYNLAGNRINMAKKIIDIQGFIGAGGYSSQYVKNALKEAKDDDVEVHINSLGGDVSHAIAIKDALQAHGKIIAVYSGMSASSATIISLGCKSIKMTKDSFYLVHKPMMYVDAWGAMNEDELKQLIEKLDSQLESTQKVTLQIASMYADKTGKSMKDVIDLMKKQVWITAEEAKTWGFIDEITEPVKVTDYANDQKLVALIAGNDLPPLPRKEAEVLAIENDIVARIKKAGEAIIEEFKNLFSNHKTNSQMANTKMYALLCVALVLDELKVDDKGGIFLNKEQLDKLEAEMKNLQDAKTLAETNLTAANTAKDNAVKDLGTANTEKEAAVNALTAASTALDDLAAPVKEAKTIAEKVEAVRKELGKKPASGATGAQNSTDNPHKKIEGADEVSDYVKKVV